MSRLGHQLKSLLFYDIFLGDLGAVLLDACLMLCSDLSIFFLLICIERIDESKSIVLAISVEGRNDGEGGESRGREKGIDGLHWLEVDDDFLLEVGSSVAFEEEVVAI
jgi:hypothetical protein